MTDEPVFSDSDELQWHQLDLLRRIAPPSKASKVGNDEDALEAVDLESWGLPEDLDPYPWQHAALEAWEKNERSGIVKVVTGAGKTVLALMCLDRLLREDADVRASVVVPTRVLLDQWYQELTDTLSLPEAWVGRRSADYKDEFSTDRRVMIYVINSARTGLGRSLSHSALEAHHFLIVDECHRAGSRENRAIFEIPRRYALGLSATPERDDESESALESSEDVPDVIQEALGPVIFELTFQEALEEDIIPPFELIHCAVELTPKEREAYDKLSRELRELKKRLRQEPAYLAGKARVSNEFRLIKSLARREDSKAGKLAARFEALTSRRKELLYRAENRRRCFASILTQERTEGDVRLMVFHERIEEINRLFDSLVRDDAPVVLDHTGLTQSQRERSLELYLRGIAPILLSVKALIEGVNAPATDVGVIVAASASPRQKIQSLGRVMRRYPEKETSRIYNVYVRRSADENIFRRMNFERILGVGRVEYRLWREAGQWEVLDGPPHVPLPPDKELDPKSLQTEDPYPGEDAGLELSVDTQGNVHRDVSEAGRTYREYLQIPEEILECIQRIREGGGPIRITETCRYVLVPARNMDGEWDLFYAGQLPESLQWSQGTEDRIPLKISARHGGSVIVETRRGQLYDVRSPAARKILSLAGRFEKESGERIHKVEVSSDRGVFTRIHGRERRLGGLEERDGWPLGRGSFDEFRREVQNGA